METLATIPQGFHEYSKDHLLEEDRYYLYYSLKQDKILGIFKVSKSTSVFKDEYRPVWINFLKRAVDRRELARIALRVYVELTPSTNSPDFLFKPIPEEAVELEAILHNSVDCQ